MTENSNEDNLKEILGENEFSVEQKVIDSNDKLEVSDDISENDNLQTENNLKDTSKEMEFNLEQKDIDSNDKLEVSDDISENDNLQTHDTNENSKTVELPQEQSLEDMSTNLTDSNNLNLNPTDKIEFSKVEQDIKLNEENDNKENLLILNKSGDKIEDNDKSTDDKLNEEDTTDIVDILGNGLLTKKTLERGLGRETRPSHGDTVKISYKGFNSLGEEFESDEVNFVVGDGDMIQAFDLAICLAEKQETFELKTSARFAYGSIGNLPLVKPDENLKYIITLNAVDDPPDYTTFMYDDRLEAADKKRERGNYFYRREDYSLAVSSYSKALKIINTDPEFNSMAIDKKKEKLFDLFVKVTNNLAAAQLKLESYDSVIETCNSLLEYDPSNVKALFRKGKSLGSKGHFTEAITVLKQGLKQENSKLISNEIQNCYSLKRAEDEQRARICRRMFSSSSKSATTTKTSRFVGFKNLVYKYSPYIGAIFVTGISVTFAVLAVNRSKEG